MAVEGGLITTTVGFTWTYIALPEFGTRYVHRLEGLVPFYTLIPKRMTA